MIRLRLRPVLVLTALLFAPAAQAQDAFSSIGAAAISMGEAGVRQAQWDNVASVGPRGAPGPRGRGDVRSTALEGDERGSAVSLSYQPTRALTQQVGQEVVGRLRRSDPAAAQALADQLGRHDFAAVYRGITAPFGVRDNDAADAVAAYTALGWIIANQAPDPTPSQVRGLRDQLAGRLAAEPRINNPAARAKLGEEMKILFVGLHAGWQSSRREGPGALDRFADGVAQLFQRQGTDLRRVVLTDSGFAAR